ncbi:50S ribosomal protein L11 methyltransferase [Sphingosinicella sp. LHD-64]|nr:50S ribosomal protein L11 methyltransferase [Sphingosinicella sp. LHD-64]MDQ8755950.1 50S ribosomal protein L11 methyltransferase [Sphingosinicella sp. LHD-64]
MSDSWKVTLPCTRAEAERLKGDIAAFAALDMPPVLMTSEVDGGAWRLDAYFEAEPSKADLALLRTLVSSAAGTATAVERIGDADWVTLSQAGLEPIRAGRFFVHTPTHRGKIPTDAVAFEIDAGLAFGTGHHETTTGCLIALDRLKAGGAVFANIADIGTGTGLLAFAALKLWPVARAIASDIDPIAIEVTAENAAINRVPLGQGPGQMALAVAPGLDHRRLTARVPYDLVIANILAGPLIDLAPDIAAALAPGGRLILAGLLDHQAPRVLAAYRRRGFAPAGRIDRGEWPTLVLRRRPRFG